VAGGIKVDGVDQSWTRLVLCLLLMVAALGGCARPEVGSGLPADVPAVGSATTSAPQQRPAGRAFAVLADESLLTIRAYRAGTLARLGHNHVIASRHLRGSVLLAEPRAASSLQLLVPVALLSVDEPELRALAGADFEAPVPDSARDGTRTNLLGEALLDAGRYPGIEISSVGLRDLRTEDATTSTAIADLKLRVRDRDAIVAIPVRMARVAADRLRLDAEFELRQSELGLQPFSVMLGALQVEDRLLFELVLVASAGRWPVVPADSAAGSDAPL